MSEERTRLLFVEDDEVDRLAFERFVRARRLSYDYVVADSVSAARRALESGSFETVISDFTSATETPASRFTWRPRAWESRSTPLWRISGLTAV